MAKAETFVNDKLVEDWNLSDFSFLDSLDPAIWVIPEGDKTWDSCDLDSRYPKVIIQPYIPYPEKAMLRGLHARVLVSVLIRR